MRAECRARLHRRERLDQGREDHPELHRHRQQDGVEEVLESFLKKCKCKDVPPEVGRFLH